MRPAHRATLAAAALAASAAAAWAQSAPAPKTDLDAKPGTLSDKLAPSGGVIKPTTDVDPAIRKPTPSAGSMPVVKPGQVPPQTKDGAAGKGGLY